MEIQTASHYMDALLLDAQRQGASDIHFEINAESARIRLRIDGLLQEQKLLQKQDYANVIARLKVLAKLDIAQQYLPQDGRLTYPIDDKNIEYRINICPTLFGEKVVLRICKNDRPLPLSQLGLLPQHHQLIIKHIEKTQGLILVTGPTGSGKTATLYALLEHLNTPQKNICTIEDPIEQPLKGINQVAVNNKTGLTYALGLKAFLRQDPDIIMVGEIRDEETAKMAIRAAQTGHLVLATLHTSSAVAAISRLQNLEVATHNLNSALRLIINQRLVRKQQGKQFKGRQGLFELIENNESFSTALSENKPHTELQRIAWQAGGFDLQHHADILIKQKITTIEEVQRIL